MEPTLPLLPESLAMGRAKEAGLDELLGTHNLFRVCLHHPPMAQIVGGVVENLVRASKLDPRVRELAILRASWRLGSAYEWSHHYVIGRRAGLTDDEVVGVRDWRRYDGFGAPERAALAAVDQAFERGTISDKTIARCRRLFGDEALIEIVLLPGLYRTVATLLASLHVPLEPAYDLWPPDGVAPPPD